MFFTDGVSSRVGATEEDVNARVRMTHSASKVLGYTWTNLGYKDQQLDTYPQLELNRSVEAGVQARNPDIVYTHWDQDNNLDHRLVSQACQVACRSVGEIFMGKPNGYWTHHHFGNSELKDVSDVVDVKQKALDYYRDELGEVVADPFEGFYRIMWTKGTL